jgi:hypothetical protein
MTFNTAALIIILLLMGYIIYIHFRLARMNIFIESTLKKLSGIVKSLNNEELKEFVIEIEKLHQYKSQITDKLFDKETLDFIFENEINLNTYLHYTRDKDVAGSIIQDGFRFANSFHKTALQVLKDNLDLKIKHINKKHFGEYIIVISISRDVYNFYSLELEKAAIRNCAIENILTDVVPVKDSNSDLIFLLPHQFIKGYVNYVTGEIVRNPDFDPWYNSPEFLKNIGRLKQ